MALDPATEFGGEDAASGVPIDTRGRIVAVGSAYNDARDDYEFAVARYLSD